MAARMTGAVEAGNLIGNRSTTPNPNQTLRADFWDGLPKTPGLGRVASFIKSSGSRTPSAHNRRGPSGRISSLSRFVDRTPILWPRL
jgi:hypothetical protein